jgi:hypothetical protein
MSLPELLEHVSFAVRNPDVVLGSGPGPGEDERDHQARAVLARFVEMGAVDVTHR